MELESRLDVLQTSLKLQDSPSIKNRASDISLARIAQLENKVGVLSFSLSLSVSFPLLLFNSHLKSLLGLHHFQGD